MAVIRVHTGFGTTFVASSRPPHAGFKQAKISRGSGKSQKTGGHERFEKRDGVIAHGGQCFLKNLQQMFRADQFPGQPDSFMWFNEVR